MTGMELLKGFGDISEEMLAEAVHAEAVHAEATHAEKVEYRNHQEDGERGVYRLRPGWTRIAAAAASVVVIFGGIFGTGLYRRFGMTGSNPAGNSDVVYVPGTGVAMTEEAAGSADLPVVESYAVDGEACYVAPKNGEINTSMPLRNAMAYYGDQAAYRVIVELFHDENGIGFDSAEMAEVINALDAIGYRQIRLERVIHQDAASVLLTMLLTKGEVKHFAEAISGSAAANYGFMFYLYREYVREEDQVEILTADIAGTESGGQAAEIIDTEPDDQSAEIIDTEPGDQPVEVYEGWSDTFVSVDVLLADARTADLYCGRYFDSTGMMTILLTEDTPENEALICDTLGIDPARVIFREATFTLQYLTALQGKITEKMVHHELPFVYGSGVYEMENRVILDVSTDDDTMLEEVRRLDTIGGALVFRVGQQATAE